MCADGHGRWPVLVMLPVLGALLVACSPSYQSGTTLCSDKGECPSGWTCAGGTCHESPASAADAPRDGSVTPDVVGAGCTAAAPVSCPASGDRAAVCLPAGRFCASAVSCENTVNSCSSADQVADCQGLCSPAASCNPAAVNGACEGCLVQKCCSIAIRCANEPTCNTNNTGPIWDEFLVCGRRYCETICQMMPPP